MPFSPAVRWLLVLLLFSAPSWCGNDYRQSGDYHFYSLEYDQAIQDYSKMLEENPADPIPYNELAATHLYKELFRLGLLDSAALGRNNAFLHEKTRPDPKAEAAVLDALEKGRRAAEPMLAKDPHDKNALYALCSNYSLEGNYEFLLKKAWFSALRSASHARSYCEQVMKQDPNLIDAYLTPGVFEYVAGSLPLPVKLLASVGGLHGSKKKGIQMVRRVAEDGDYERDNARVLLAIMYRREGRPLEAAQMVEGLLKQYPKNYIFRVEMASMYDEAGQSGRALYALRRLTPADRQLMPSAMRQELTEIEEKLEARNSTQSLTSALH